MRVAKWGNSLAMRLPAAVVEGVALKEGDHIEIRIAGKRPFAWSATTAPRKPSNLFVARGVRASEFKFDRQEANER